MTARGAPRRGGGLPPRGEPSASLARLGVAATLAAAALLGVGWTSHARAQAPEPGATEDAPGDAGAEPEEVGGDEDPGSDEAPPGDDGPEAEAEPPGEEAAAAGADDSADGGDRVEPNRAPADAEETGGPADAEETGKAPDGEETGEPADGEETADASDGATATDPEDADEAPRRSRDAELFRYDEGSGDQTLAGVLTLVGAAVGVAGLAILIERVSAVDQCFELESRDPPTEGCANVAEIRDQRNVGIGVLVGGFSLAIGAGIAGAVLAATQADEGEAAFLCVGPACVGRF